jgi:hypothetical protein
MLFFRNVGLALGAGYILFFCSERLFWSVFKPGDSVSELAVTWLAYSTIAYWFLALIERFEAESARAVLLAGACYGWMTEGMLVGTLYGTEDSAPFPFSVVCTGLSWHALISVGVGWYAVQNCCRRGRSVSLLGWAVLLGVFWGIWATFLWSEKPPVRATVGAFAGHAFVMGLLFFASHTAVCRLDARRFHARPFGLVLTGGILLVFYAQQVKTLGVRPLVVLPVLLGAVVWAMSRGRRRRPAERHQEEKEKDEDKTTREASEDRVAERAAESESRPGRPGWGLLLMPLAATLMYAALSRVEGWERVPVAEILMYWVTAPAGAAMFVWAFCRSMAGQGFGRHCEPQEEGKRRS